MPAERLSMRTIREVLRLKWQEQLSVNKHAKMTPCRHRKMTPLKN